MIQTLFINRKRFIQRQSVTLSAKSVTLLFAGKVPPLAKNLFMCYCNGMTGNNTYRGSGMRKMFFSALIIFLTVTIFPLRGIENKAGTVRAASTVLLRLAPDGVILGRVPEGTLLEMLPEKNLKWAKVRLPREIFLWTAVSGISRENTLKVSAPLRTGPGAFYPTPGKAKGGEKVIRLEKSPGGIWQKIQLPDSFLSCYALRRDLVFLSAEESGKKTEKKQEKIYFEESASATGIISLLPEKEWKNNIRYALAVQIRNTVSIRAFLEGPDEQFSRWKNRQIRITGKRIWKEGFSRPVFLPEKIEPAWNN